MAAALLLSRCQSVAQLPIYCIFCCLLYEGK
jgi:hypothetical protein